MDASRKIDQARAQNRHGGDVRDDRDRSRRASADETHPRRRVESTGRAPRGHERPCRAGDQCGDDDRRGEVVGGAVEQTTHGSWSTGQSRAGAETRPREHRPSKHAC